MKTTPLPIRIMVRRMTFLPDNTNVPEDALREYFLAWNIDLTFSEGAVLVSNPTDDPYHINKLLSLHAPPVGTNLPWPAILLICDQYMDDPGTNGILLDANRRGASAVYVISNNFCNGNADARFQIFAHEIGHLLNLTHAEANEVYPTAMNQWARRTDQFDRMTAWNSAINDAPPANRSRISAFFNSGQRTLVGLPLSRESASYLENYPDQDILPWRKKFRDKNTSGIFDRAILGLSMTVELQHDRIGVAEPLDFGIKLQLARDAAPVEIPTTIGLKFGTLSLRIRGADGYTHTCLSRTVACGGTSTSLQPGEFIVKNFSLLADRSKLLFSRPGEYILELSIPSLSLYADSITINVAPATHPLLANKSFQKFLENGLPQSHSKHWKGLDGLIAAQEVSESMRSHLVELRFSMRPHSKKNPHLFRLVDELGYVAKRVRERMLLLRIVRTQKTSRVDYVEVRRLLDEARNFFTISDHRHPSINFLNYVEARISTGGKQ